MNFHTDIVVAGGGPAGVAAAIAAARLGGRVLLLERYGFLGGMATAALVNPFQISKINGQLIHRGIFLEVVEALQKHNAAIEGSLFGQHHIAFDHEELKFVLHHMVRNANVKLLHHVFVSGAIMQGDMVAGVQVESKSGGIRIFSKVVIDCTGDADVAVRAGAPFEKGRGGDGVLQPMTMNFNMAGVDMKRLPAREEQNKLFQEAKVSGRLTVPREKLLWFETTRSDEIHFNTTRVIRVDGTNVEDLTRAEMEGRLQVEEIVQFLKRCISGYENAHLSAIGPQIGVRETNRIVGEYVITEKDVWEGRKFDDAISSNAYPLDIHNPEGEGTVWKPLPEGVYYTVPYRALIPQKVEGILVAGRPISSTHEAHSSIRVMPHCMNIGEAAGIAAALAVKHRKRVHEVPASLIQEKLRENGAFLPS